MYHHHVLLNIYEEMQTVESVPCPWLLDISTLGVETGERGGGGRPTCYSAAPLLHSFGN